MGKERIHLRLTAKNMARLERAAMAPGVTKSQIADAALSAYFDPDETDSREAALLRRLDRFDLKQNAIERDTALIAETLGQFVLYWLTRTEPLPEGERETAHDLGQRRFEYFINQVAEKLGTDDRLWARIAPRVADDDAGDD